MATAPFPFLSLPKDIRLMVYEHFTLELTFRRFTLPIGTDDYSDRLPSNFALALRRPFNALLATCRTIAEEAAPVFAQLMGHQPKAPIALVYLTKDHRRSQSDVIETLAGFIGLCDRVRDVAKTGGVGKSAEDKFFSFPIFRYTRKVKMLTS